MLPSLSSCRGSDSKKRLLFIQVYALQFKPLFIVLYVSKEIRCKFAKVLQNVPQFFGVHFISGISDLKFFKHIGVAPIKNLKSLAVFMHHLFKTLSILLLLGFPPQVFRLDHLLRDLDLHGLIYRVYRFLP